MILGDLASYLDTILTRLAVVLLVPLVCQKTFIGVLFIL